MSLINPRADFSDMPINHEKRIEELRTQIAELKDQHEKMLNEIKMINKLKSWFEIKANLRSFLIRWKK